MLTIRNMAITKILILHACMYFRTDNHEGIKAIINEIIETHHTSVSL
jgi:hypothetical protein